MRIFEKPEKKEKAWYRKHGTGKLRKHWKLIHYYQNLIVLNKRHWFNPSVQLGYHLIVQNFY